MGWYVECSRSSYLAIKRFENDDGTYSWLNFDGRPFNPDLWAEGQPVEDAGECVYFDKDQGGLVVDSCESTHTVVCENTVDPAAAEYSGGEWNPVSNAEAPTNGGCLAGT